MEYPDKTAVVASGRRVSYLEFDEAVNRCAHALDDRGLGQGDRLGILSRNCWQFVVITFAAARLGVVLVPVNFTLTSHEVAFILEHAEVAGMIAEDTLLGIAEEALQKAHREDAVRGRIPFTGGATGGFDEWLDVDVWIDGAGDVSHPHVMVNDEASIRLMYTSGTESRPKGVLLTSRWGARRAGSGCQQPSERHRDEMHSTAISLKLPGLAVEEQGHLTATSPTPITR